MKGSAFFLFLVVALAICIFVVSWMYTHETGVNLFKDWTESAPTSTTLTQLTTLTQATTPNPFDRPAVIDTVHKQRAFPNKKGISSSEDFQKLMQEAKLKPNPEPLRRQRPAAAKENRPAKANPSKQPQQSQETVQVLNCKKTNDATCKMYWYVKFWNARFSPADCVESPLRPALRERTPIHEQKYLVFEPDRGGWNNIRMAAETAILFAHATGRTLVLPPAARWYLLDKSSNQTDNISTFSKFFDLRRLKESMTMITMEDFLARVATQPGFLKKTLSSAQEIPALLKGDKQRLWDYLGAACYTEQWEPGKQFIGFNLSRNHTGIFGEISADTRNNPRLKAMVAHGRKLRIYDRELHEEKAVYFPGDYRNTHRILTHFYTYLYWANTQEERVYRRLVRDRLHYHDSVFCAASQLVFALHADASILSHRDMPNEQREAHTLSRGGDTNKGATYFAMHIRRGDFQYQETKLSAEQIVENTFHLLDPNVTRLLYISTDEQDKSFFEPFTRGPFVVKFLKDYFQEERVKQAVPDFSMNHIGMIEQVVCANAHTFIGTPYSTFTGYITRMRGYYRDGRYERTFYTMESVEKQLQQQRTIVGPFWAREFETAHKDIDGSR